MGLKVAVLAPFLSPMYEFGHRRVPHFVDPLLSQGRIFTNLVGFDAPFWRGFFCHFTNKKIPLNGPTLLLLHRFFILVPFASARQSFPFSSFLRFAGAFDLDVNRLLCIMARKSASIPSCLYYGRLD